LTAAFGAKLKGYVQFGMHKYLSLPRRLLGRFHVDLAPDPSASTLLVGSPRSGTTWVEEIINYKNEYRVIFEPFQRAALWHDFREWEYHPPGEANEAFAGRMRTTFTGKLRDRRTDSRNRKWLCRRRLIKSVRAHLLLNWLHAQYPEVPIILLLRHPCAVADSWQRKGWTVEFGELLEQTELMAGLLAPFREQIETTQDPFDRAVLRWCITNYVPVKQFRKGDIHLAFYENFCETPEAEIRRMFDFLGKGFDSRVLRMVRRPSLLSKKDSAIITGASLVDSWRERVTPEQTQRAVELLKLFRLDRMYGESSMPDTDAAVEMLDDASE